MNAIGTHLFCFVLVFLLPLQPRPFVQLFFDMHERVSRDQILRHERGQGKKYFPCSADHEHDWQPYPVDPYSCCMCGHTCMSPDSHTHLPNICLRPILFLFLSFFCFFGDIVFFRVLFVPLDYRFLFEWRVRCTSFASGWCLKKNQNAPTPSEHPPVMGKKCQNV